MSTNIVNCQNHNQSTIYYDRSQKDPKLQYLCIQCIAEIRQNFLLVDDVEQQLSNLQTLLFQEKDSLHYKNCQILMSLKESLAQLKQKINMKIDKCLECTNQQLMILNDSQRKFEKQIQDLPIQNYDQFISQYQELEKSQINLKGINDIIQKGINQIFKEKDINECIDILNKFDQGKESQQQNIFKSFKEKIAELLQSNKKISLICEIHNSKIKMIDLNPIKTIPTRLACLDCVAQFPIKYTNIKQFTELSSKYSTQQQSYINNYNEKFQQRETMTKKLLQETHLKFTNLIQSTSSNLKNIDDNFEQRIQQFSQLITAKQDFSQKDKIIDMADKLSQSQSLDDFHNLIQIEFKQFEEQYQQQISNIFLSLTNMKILFNSQQESQIQTTQKLEMQEQIADQQNQDIRNNNQIIDQQKQQELFSYELLNIDFPQIHGYCGAIALNENMTTIFAGFDQKIKVFEFMNQSFKEIQLLCKHFGVVTTLNYLKKSKQLVSGSNDQQIIIWAINQNSQWYILQAFDAHTKFLICLVINNLEDQIISGSYDCVIQFWKKCDDKWDHQQSIKDHQDIIWSLSLSQSQNRIVSCGNDNLILVIEYQSKQWFVIQKIKTELKGYRICFINDDIFAFQQYNKDKLDIYESNKTTSSFTLTKQVSIKNGINCCPFFPSQYVKQKSILINKNGNYVNVIKKLDNNEFQIVQSIDFGHISIQGILSDDAQYLLTWCRATPELQIRKYIKQ